MEIKIKFTEEDVWRVRDVVKRMAEHPFVIERRKRNVERQEISLSHQTMWKIHIGCLLTTRQKSSEGSAVQNFIASKSLLLSLHSCEAEDRLAKFAEAELTRLGGIRFTTVISQRIQKNMNWLKDDEWQKLETSLSHLKKKPQPKKVERLCATQVAQMLEGFGPKQSRNFLQWLGLTQHEIPIDSRIINWLKEPGGKGSLPLLSSAALGESGYYCCIMDSLQDLCKDASVLPCIFDASVFASGEKPQGKKSNRLG